MEKKENRVDEGVARLITQYKEAETTKAFVEVTIEDSQDKEDASFELMTERWLDTSIGAQLDRYGEDLNVFREGRDDDLYRTKIKAQIVRYQSSGQYRKLVDAFKLIAGVENVHVKEIFPAAFALTGTLTDDDVTSDPEDIAETMRNAKAAGVGIESISVGESPTFAYLGYPDPEAKGYATVEAPDSGGHYAQIRNDLIPQLKFAYVGAPGDVSGYGDLNNYSPLSGGFYRN